MSDHIARLRAFKFYFDKGSAVASDELRDAMKLLDDYDALSARLSGKASIARFRDEIVRLAGVYCVAADIGDLLTFVSVVHQKILQTPDRETDSHE